MTLKTRKGELAAVLAEKQAAKVQP